MKPNYCSDFGCFIENDSDTERQCTYIRFNSRCNLTVWRHLTQLEIFQIDSTCSRTFSRRQQLSPRVQVRSSPKKTKWNVYTIKFCQAVEIRMFEFATCRQWSIANSFKKNVSTQGNSVHAPKVDELLTWLTIVSVIKLKMNKHSIECDDSFV